MPTPEIHLPRSLGSSLDALTHEQMRVALTSIAAALYGDPDAEWNSDTLMAVADVLERTGLKPEAFAQNPAAL